MMKRGLLLLVLMLPMLSMAQKKVTFEGITKANKGYFTYEYGCLYIQPNAAGDVTIPARITVDGVTYEVQKVRTEYSRVDNNIRRLVLPETVKEIKLSGCKNLEEVILPNSLEKISDFCFSGCTKLKRITIPSSVTEIGSYAFYNSGIMNITLPPQLKKVEEATFLGCSNLREIVIPNAVDSIKTRAFCSCSSLRDVHLGNSLKYIGEGVFASTSIEELIIPNSVEKINHNALESMEKLKYLVVPDRDVVIEGRSLYDSFGHHVELIMGHQSLLPKWVRPYVWEFSPFAKNGMKAIAPFSLYAKVKIGDLIDTWQQKGEFETVRQWQERVTKEHRDSIVATEMAKLRKEYIERYKPTATVEYILGTYDTENMLFPISINGNSFNMLYAHVPLAEAPNFKQTFSSDAIKAASYGIVNDFVGVTSYVCSLNGKKYELLNAAPQDENDIALNLPPLELDFGQSGSSTTIVQDPVKRLDRTIDNDIPLSDHNNSKTFAVIIGNENYSMVNKVPYAKNDAMVFAEYCRKTLGLPAKNVRTYGDATYVMMRSAVKDIQDIAKAYNGDINVIFYYAGHGIPNEQSRDAYLLPIDADGRQTDFCYSVGQLYQSLGSMGAKNVLVLMDACFSGSLRGDGMLMAARGVAIKAKTDTPQGNMVVMTASSAEETAFAYEEKGHGLFTYFLLEKLRETKGQCTLGELSDYIKTAVRQHSLVVNRKAQTPTISISHNIMESWKSIRLQ